MLTEKRKAYLRDRYKKNRLKIREAHLRWRIQNREHLKAYRLKNAEKKRLSRRADYIKNREAILQKKRDEYRQNADSYKARAKKWRANNRDRANELKLLWIKRNPERFLEMKRAEYRRKKLSPFKSLNMRMGRLLYMALRKRGAKAGISWRQITGYSVQELADHLKSKFTPGMTWDAFCRGEIHIDHIVPISWHKYDSFADPEFKKCWGLSNLQPLWASENLKKQARWSGTYEDGLRAKSPAA